MPEREVKDWITINGVHVPIYEGETKDDAAKRAITKQKENIKKNEDLKEKQIAKNKEEVTRKNLGEVGEPSPNGEMKHVTLYHGSFQDFKEFDYEKGKQAKSGGSDQYGQGFYFTADKEQARAFGNIIYTVDVSYSTDFRTAKKTGREKDFSYNKSTGYWVIPPNKAGNLKIKKKEKVD